MTLYKIFLVFIGGGLGSLCRYLISIQFHNPNVKLPLTTLAANILSCFILGIAYKNFTLDGNQSWIWFFVMIGFCGGMSTFSTFTAENFQLLQQSRFLVFSAYILLSVTICLLAFWLGYLK